VSFEITRNKISHPYTRPGKIFHQTSFHHLPLFKPAGHRAGAKKGKNLCGGIHDPHLSDLEEPFDAKVSPIKKQAGPGILDKIEAALNLEAKPFVPAHLKDEAKE